MRPIFSITDTQINRSPIFNFGHRFAGKVRKFGPLNHNFELIKSLTLIPRDIISEGLCLEGINFNVSGFTNFLILIFLYDTERIAYKR